MDEHTQSFVKQVAAECPHLTSIWLFGSRANGTEKATSDWDFLAFGSDEALKFLRAATHLHRDNTDFFVVTNEENFVAAWGEKDKAGSLSGWEWKRISELIAEYTQTKSIEQEDGSRVELTRMKAVKVWPRHESAR